jgi:hypothetical protein
MHLIKNRLFLFIISMALCQNVHCQSVDTVSFTLVPRLSFCSCEKNAEFLLHVPARLSHSELSVRITIGGNPIATWKGRAGGGIIRISGPVDLAPAVYRAIAGISAGRGLSFLAATNLIILQPRSNEVKTDRLTGGLIVNRRQFYPFGFYCYSPVDPSLPGDEVVNGFNMISPYQNILPETLSERKAYMDRCAELGMKVHYNLLSLSGGGGTGYRKGVMTGEEKKKLLVEEIKIFMDHPALLGWYISDEPNGTNVTPEDLTELYRLVKETDPWHPVSIVFMAPFLSSKKYADALDIVMADPYPVPDYPVTLVGKVTAQLKSEFKGKRPVWTVLQAFGGGEWWSREPTFQEIRSMTWQAVTEGATGIQYFVRQGPNYFPKSPAVWSECGRMATEVAELTPWLLSDEEPLAVRSSSRNITVSSRLHDGQLLIMAVNKINEPVPVTITITGIYSGKATLPFENRSLPVTGGNINDNIAPFGSQAYLIDIKPPKHTTPLPDANLIKDPGFEDIAGFGIPSACYARPGGEKGATYFLDTREHHDGNHSMRLITPVEGKGVSLRLFPFSVKAGATYAISVWAKSDPDQRFLAVTNKQEIPRENIDRPFQYVEISLGGFGKARFVPDGEWKRYMTFVTIPVDTVPNIRTNLILRMPGQGIAWFDEMKVYEEK